MFKKICLLSVVLLTACTMGGNTKQPQLADTYQDNAILMRIEASKDLNLYNDQKHTLKLVIIQVEKVEDVQKQLMSSDSIAKLLDSADDSEDSKNKAGDKQVYMHTLFITPGSKKVYTFPRLAGARRIIVVAGYYDLVPNQVVRVFEIPVFENWKPVTFWEMNRKMGRIAICLMLGAKGINFTDSTSKETTTESLK
ncbi:Type VI secretion lipoprotein [Legionella quinlivanii]|uniref:Type VI secretion lipoprotein n=1 Tax=Legionella quinlivanii TaxID=45073 RepID=A0A0W0XZT6_9GAMM|nr:type VI secretion lipoprotein TssJ [Legionella quinlivanii]KTD50248.1 Type VI secretion lipoprotein [Legionella quinlivanii]MCW8450008.1 type VI secretion lipoprotein TssJ [Legionella quinlivanii]SEF46012.1 Type VI secretion lipoprotein, VasD, EvfM, TssJ, VC_A0113 [Legionella quinlivanii DSM 21216]